MEKGLILHGTICASNTNSGLRKDDGKPWARRNAVITTGSKVFTYSESIDPTVKTEDFPINKLATVQVDYANTTNGMTSVGGQLEILK